MLFYRFVLFSTMSTDYKHIVLCATFYIRRVDASTMHAPNEIHKDRDFLSHFRNFLSFPRDIPLLSSSLHSPLHRLFASPLQRSHTQIVFLGGVNNNLTFVRIQYTSGKPAMRVPNIIYLIIHTHTDSRAFRKMERMENGERPRPLNWYCLGCFAQYLDILSSSTVFTIYNTV